MNRGAETLAAEKTPASLKTGIRLADYCCLGVALIYSLAIALLAQRFSFGYIPQENSFFEADTIRVLTNLDGSTENYYRLKVHPLYGWICILYQTLFVRLQLASEAFAIPFLSIAIGLIDTALLYLVLRRFSIRPLAAMTFAMFFCSSATYVFWSTVPETHMAGGASVLLTVLLMTPGPTKTRARAILGFAVSFSMVVTDVLVWLLVQIDFSTLRQGRFRSFLLGTLANAGQYIRSALWGLLLIAPLWALQYPLLGKRIGLLFNFLEERHYFQFLPSLTLNIFGIVAPLHSFSFVPGLICVAILFVSLIFLTPELWFIALFPLIGAALHTFYGGEGTFLFSPNYIPLFVVAFALAVNSKLPRWSPIVALPLTVPLAWFNLSDLYEMQRMLFESHQMIKLP